MSDISLNIVISSGATVVPSVFIEKFMNTASAAHLRFFLYLMYLSQNRSKFSLTDACDFLEDSEKDILRSINYWEKKGVLSVIRDGDTIISITTSPLTSDSLPLPEVSFTDSDILPADTPAEELDLKYIIKKITEFSGRILSSAEIEFLCELNDRHNFSTELIIYLYEYCCVQKGINRFNYIESVALAWIDKGFKNVEDAKHDAKLFNKENAAVMKAFGLSRLPGTSELQFIDTWFHTYNLSSELVVEACNRTMLQLSKPDFKYTNGTLKHWFKNNIKTLDDVKAYDKLHYMSNYASNKPANRSVNNRFTNFEQRNYDNSEMKTLTKNLLNSH